MLMVGLQCGGFPLSMIFEGRVLGFFLKAAKKIMRRVVSRLCLHVVSDNFEMDKNCGSV